MKYKSSLPKGYIFDLPTEAQWEYACRAGTTTDLNNGKNLTTEEGSCPNLDEVAWYKKNSDETHPVGQKKPNAWGIYDMHGNVKEWCRDMYCEDFYSLRKEYIDPYNIYGCSHVSGRVFRGGSWFDDAGVCRSADRSYGGKPWDCNRYLGFRLALVPVQ
jgi:formylglycine-generating enzyme required for sulfatase activity